MCDVGSYILGVGRVADRENCACVRVTFERSGPIRVRRKATLIINEGSMILRGLAELRFINQRCQIDLKSIL